MKFLRNQAILLKIETYQIPKSNGSKVNIRSCRMHISNSIAGYCPTKRFTMSVDRNKTKTRSPTPSRLVFAKAVRRTLSAPPIWNRYRIPKQLQASRDVKHEPSYGELIQILHEVQTALQPYVNNLPEPSAPARPASQTGASERSRRIPEWLSNS